MNMQRITIGTIRPGGGLKVHSRSENYPLSPKTIDTVSGICVQALTEAGADKKDIIRVRLSLEEILGVWLEPLAGAMVHVDCGQKFGRAYLRVSVDGPTIDPWNDETLVLSSRMLSQAGLSFTYAYKDGKNCLVCNPKKKKSSMGQLAWLLGAVFLAAFLGFALRRAPSMQTAALSVTEPLFNMILGALRAVSSPLVFLAVCCGIVSIGDLTMVGRVGKKLILRMVAGTFVLAVVMALAGCLLFPIASEAGGEIKGNYSAIYQMVLDIVPSDIVSPFLNGNALQLVFLGTCVGAAFLILGERVSAAQNTLLQVNEAVGFLMSVLGKIIPLFVFLSLFNLILSDFDSGFSSLFKVFAITIPVCFILTLFYVFVAAVRLKVSPILLIRKMLPTFLIALTTASSAAALATNLETCVKELGIPKKVADFGIPLGQVLYKPGFVVGLFSLALCMAESYGIPITPLLLFMSILTVGLLSMALPPIPGGALSVFTVMFAQLGIPSEALALAVAGNAILDFFMTAAGVACLQVQVTLAAESVGMLDENKLKRSMS